jgi:acyl-CoA thioesterase-1
MFRFLITVGLALLWSVSAASNSPDVHRVLVFGDSLSAAHGIDGRSGWVNLLEQRIGQREPPWDVHNASVGGETTAGGRTRLPDLLEQVQPDLVILELGGNDGLRGLSLRAMRENLGAMLEAIETAGATALLVGIEIPPNYGPVYTERFRAVFHDLATEHDVALLPFLLEGVALEAEMMLDDGIHPSAQAQPRILENVWTLLEPLLQERELEAEKERLSPDGKSGVR